MGLVQNYYCFVWAGLIHLARPLWAAALDHCCLKEKCPFASWHVVASSADGDSFML